MPYFVNLLIAYFAKPHLNVYWVSDQDDIFANPTLSADVAKLMSGMTSMRVKFPLGELGVGTTDIDEDDRMHEDIAAISKMVKGSPTEGLFYFQPKGLTKKTDIISDWLADETQNLSRVTIIFDKIGNQTKIWRLTTG